MLQDLRLSGLAVGNTANICVMPVSLTCIGLFLMVDFIIVGYFYICFYVFRLDKVDEIGLVCGEVKKYLEDMRFFVVDRSCKLSSRFVILSFGSFCHARGSQYQLQSLLQNHRISLIVLIPKHRSQ